MTNNRYSNGRTKLKKGETQRTNGTFMYRWSDTFGGRHTVYAKTLEELREKEEAVLKDNLEGIHHVTSNTTVDSYFEIWKGIKSGIRDSTFTAYLKVYRNYIGPHFGSTPLNDLCYSNIVLFYKRLLEKQGLSIETVRHINLVLSMILEVAIRDGVLRKNPCYGALKELRRKYSGTAKEVRALTQKEQQVLEEYLNKPGRFHFLCPLITVMLYSGMRVGELGALRWADISFEKNDIQINHTLVYDCREKGGFALNPPKTKSSKRTIPMNFRIRTALLMEKARQESNKIKCNVTVDGKRDFVFLDNNGRPYHYRQLNHCLDRISKEINSEIISRGNIDGLTSFPHVHSHMLRHTFATRMREAGADIKATAEIMGHSEISITLNTYTDTSDDIKRHDISLLDLISSETA